MLSNAEGNVGPAFSSVQRQLGQTKENDDNEQSNVCGVRYRHGGCGRGFDRRPSKDKSDQAGLDDIRGEGRKARARRPVQDSRNQSHEQRLPH